MRIYNNINFTLALVFILYYFTQELCSFERVKKLDNKIFGYLTQQQLIR